MHSLETVFERLGDRDAEREAVYTTLAPLYRVMYAARGRIEGQAAIVRDVAPPDTETVVELGCGTGDLLDRLTDEYDRAVGADPSPQMCRLTDRHDVTVCRADARGFAPESADVVALLGAVLGHIRPDEVAEETVERVAATLRPGGRVVCSVHDSRQLDGVRERELTRTVDGYEITQHDEQRPTDGGEFEWCVTFEMTDRATGETRTATTATTLRGFTPAELESWFTDAGLTAVESRPRTYVDGDGEEGRAFVVVGERTAD